MTTLSTSPHSMPDGFDVLDAAHEQALFALGKLAALVAEFQARGTDASTRALAAEVAAFFDEHARVHHADEEKHVFPRLLREGDAQTVETVLRLQQDHHWLGEDWRELGAQVHAIASGQGWVDPDVLREGVLVFGALLRDHIALEESCIYPQARSGQPPRARLEMGREMAARRRAAPARAGAAHRKPQSSDATGADSLHALLLARQDELRRRIIAAQAARQAPQPAALHEVTDRKDEAARRAAEELDDAQQQIERAELAEVDAALRRLSAGAFGRCVDCGDSIAAARLLANPSSVRCASCQAAHETARQQRRA